MASPFLRLSQQSSCASPLFSLPAGLELHIDEDGGDGALSLPHVNHPPSHSPISSLSAASELDLDSVVDVTRLSPQTKSMLLLSQSASSHSNLLRNSPNSSSNTTPSLSSVNTVLDYKSPSASVERVSPSAPVYKPAHDFNFNLTFQPPSKSLTPPISATMTPSPLPAAASASPPHHMFSCKTSSPSPVSPVKVPSPLAFPNPAIPSSHLLEPESRAQRASPLALQQPPMEEPSLDEALDKLLAMTFAQSHTSTHLEELQLKMEAHSLGRGAQELQEELILPMDRNSVQPDTFNSNTMTDESVDGGTDGNGDLDWADEDLSMSFHDGLDGTMTPYTERLYTDGSMTPMTEASWMDESMTPSTCPGTPDVALDLPLLQTPNIDRVSASGHVCVSTVAQHRMLVLFTFNFYVFLHQSDASLLHCTLLVFFKA